MKSIFFISSNGFPSKTNRNTGIFTYEQAKSASLKYKTVLIDLQTNKKNLIYKDSFGGTKIHRLLYTKYNFLKVLINIIYLYNLKKKYQPSLSICSFLNLKNVFYSFILNVKTVTIIHGSDAVVTNYFKKIIYNYYLIKNHKIFTVSKYTKKILLNYFKNVLIKNKVKVVFNGFSREKLKLTNKEFLKKIPQKKIIISCIANAVPRKNIPFLINFFKELNSKYPQKYYLIIAGGFGPDSENIKYLIDRNRLKNEILFKQNLLNSEISSLLNKSKFFCLFSKEINKEFEGFGIVIIEAMFKKNIILSSYHGGIQNIIHNGKNGYLFDIKKKDVIKKIIRKINFFSNHKKERKKLISKAYSHSLNFSWEKNINEIINLSLR